VIPAVDKVVFVFKECVKAKARFQPSAKYFY